MLSGRRRGLVPVAAVLVAVVGFVVVNLRPWLWFTDTTPTGGDLGAHVWAPAYLRDVLIGEWRLTGWTHDWYAGFPAFTFYMVVPSLLVVMIDVGLDIREAVFAYLALASAAAAVTTVIVQRRRIVPRKSRPAGQVLAVVLSVAAICGAAKLFIDDPEIDRALAGLLLPAMAAWWTWYGLRTRTRWRAGAAVASAIVVLVAVPMPYGVALKLVTIAGVVALPVAVWAMARLGGVSTEGQALASAATLLFLFDRSYNIYGGNLMSTMAGEFAYSLGLACAVVFIGVAARGMPAGRHRVLAGALLALTGLLHLFGAFFALAAVAALLLVMPWRADRWRSRIWWTVSTGALAAALSAWWVLPFWWNRDLLNDMGWGKERRFMSSLWSRSEFDYSFLTNDPPLQLFIVLAVLGTGVAFFRRARLVLALALTGAIIAAGFVILPEGRLWNVRILPFYYLTVYLAAALGIGEVIRTGREAIDRWQTARAERAEDESAENAPDHRHHIGDDTRAERAEDESAEGHNGRQWSLLSWARRSAGTTAAGAAVALTVVAVIVMVGLPLHSLPGGQRGDDGVYRWGPFSSSEANLGPYWVEYNFEGYEGRGPTSDGGGSSEYWDLVETMDRIGETRGCGPAFWEYESGRLGSYGTPMAPMLLPYWTDRCIGSMEGLYFEASATVPYHFLMQSELSSAPSRAQRDLPYSGLDVARGVEHMRLMGVRYYMVFSPDALSQARASAELTEIGSTPLGPWVVFEVLDNAAVVGMSRLPVVVESIGDSSEDWLVASVGAFLAADWNRPVLAADGPADWPRMTLPKVHDDPVDELSGTDTSRQEVMRLLSAVLGDVAPSREIEPATVSAVVRDDHSISFSVDRVGSPVLVRTSYFPNWSVSGAHGPYRVTPNLMVVVPTGTEVRLTYGRSGVEWVSMALTLVGLVAAAWLVLRSRRTPEAAAGAAESSGGLSVGVSGSGDSLEAAGAGAAGASGDLSVGVSGSGDSLEAAGAGAAESSESPGSPL